MRLAWGVALIALTACKAFLGSGNMPPSDVQGTAMNVYYTSPTTTASAPEDLSTWVLQAYLPDGSPGGYRVVDVTGHKDGSFTIPSVPAGPYYLLTISPALTFPRFFQTTSHSLDLGRTFAGRIDGPRAARPTPVTLHFPGINPIQRGDSIVIGSFTTGAQIVSRPAVGATSFDTSVDWKTVATPLLDAARLDDLYVIHQRRTVGQFPGGGQQTLLEAFTITSVTLVDGQPTTITGSLTAPSVTTTENYTIDPGSYLDGLEYPSHLPVSVRLMVRGGYTGETSRGPPLLDIFRGLPSSGVVLGTTSYLDPFPADWVRSATTIGFPSWHYAARGTPRTVIYEDPGAIDTKPIAPGGIVAKAPFAAPHGIKVGGVDGSRAAAIPFDGTHPVTVEWAPVTGVHHYFVVAMHLADNGNSATLPIVAMFDTITNAAVMPPSLFHAGDSYVIAVDGVVTPTIDYGRGILLRQGYPNSRREALTARLLFAASCGNGMVDAAYEECDGSGIATAACNPDCTRPVCGDGFANTAADEACDDAGESLACNKDCTPASCGDGKVNSVRGEVCDLGSAQNGQPGACCSATCTLVPPATTCS